MGLMILAGWSCHWEWEDYLGAPVEEPYGGIITPEKISLIAQSFEDQVMWLRRHPSIFVPDHPESSLFRFLAEMM